jgi:glucosamine--fructose-6-phosphate aminotransferase (isomerizing)
MRPDFRIVEGAYCKDILFQPQALADTLEGLEESSALRAVANRLNRGELRRVVLTGMGSSFHGLHPLNIDLLGQGLAPLMVDTSELIHYQRRLFDRATLIIAVSQSGRSAEMVSMLKANRARATVVAVTNTRDSPLARNSDACVLTRAGEEFSVSCKTYVSALMALKWVGNLLGGKSSHRSRSELAHAAPIVSDYLLRWKKNVLTLAERLRGIRQLYLVGRGSSLAAVGTGGLIIKESDHFPAEGMGSAAFRHGPLEIVTAQTFVLAFSGAGRTRELNRRLVKDVRERHGFAEWAGDDSSLPALRFGAGPVAIRPILEILPVEMITLALAALAGREAGRFESATKVTTTE